MSCGSPFGAPESTHRTIVAICSLADGYPVNPSDCKYDAFKVQQGEVTTGDPLTVTKDAAGANKNTYTWNVTKDVDKTTVKQVGGSATFNYTVKVTHDGGTISAVKVTGTISVFNPNTDSLGNTVAVSGVDVSDQLSDGTVCTVANGAGVTLTFLVAGVLLAAPSLATNEITRVVVFGVSEASL